MDRHGTGRGAWLCLEKPECLDEAVRRHGFDRAFATPVDADDVQQLRVHLGDAWGRPTPDVRE